MDKTIPTMRGEIKRRSRIPFRLLMVAVIGVGGVITMIGTSHGRALTQVELWMTMAVLSVSVPMLLGAVMLSNQVKCPNCGAVLGFKNGIDACPSCRVSFDEPMPPKLVS